MYDVKNMNIWKEEQPDKELSPEFERTPVTELNLSVRSYNCLRRAGCETIGDILRVLEDDEHGGLRKIRNLGSRSEEEILQNVEKLRKEYAKRPAPPSTDSTRILVRPARRVWDRDITDFRLSNYARERLMSCGIVKVQDLYATNPRKEPGWYAVRELFGAIAKEV
ncbi:MAG: hypothetical protein IJX90_05875 [Blautia sp.]|nr:hypothetical protein [Blautia sp.]